MNYRRVIPRDLFNEASLLKSMGHLWIKLENHIGVKWSAEDVRIFKIQQDTNDGSIFIENLNLIVEKRLYKLYRPLNSRRSWALYAIEIWNNDADSVEVFTEEGDLTDDMKALVGYPKHI